VSGKELFTLGSTIAAESFTTYFLATRGSYTLTNWYRHTIDDEGFACPIYLTHNVDKPL
jgi:hypothetical protein